MKKRLKIPVLGLLACLLFMHPIMTVCRLLSPRRQAIASQHEAWVDALIATNYPQAYAFMTSQYQDTHTLADFRETFAGYDHEHLKQRRGRYHHVFTLAGKTWLIPNEGMLNVDLTPIVSAIPRLMSGVAFNWIYTNGDWRLSGEWEVYQD